MIDDRPRRGNARPTPEIEHARARRQAAQEILKPAYARPLGLAFESFVSVSDAVVTLGNKLVYITGQLVML